MKAFLSFLLLLSLARAIFAAEPATDSTPPTPEKSSPEVTIELKNKSSFALDENTRNPFWPIGWKPAAKATSNEHAPDAIMSAFVVSSITMDQGARYAIINGKVMTEGQVFGLQMGGQVYQITVKSIQDGQVILERRDQQIPVPLRRR